VAVAQWDIKRILAYSTVSQLGYMMIGLGTGGVAVGMFHLITHAFFKALLFLGAGSVIHGCGGEQDIRRMGGLRKAMPVTFAAYTCGMLALCGFPLFAGFWSKDEILHAAFHWSVARSPFYMGAAGALLTAFYMTRQMYYVYAGPSRLAQADTHAHGEGSHGAHESPAVMTVPLAILACFAVLLGFCGTAAWPWFQSFLNGVRPVFDAQALAEGAPLMLASTGIVFAGIGLGWLLYGRRPIAEADAPDPVDAAQPTAFRVLERAFLVNELYAKTVVRLNEGVGRASAWLDEYVWGGGVRAISAATAGLARLDNRIDNGVVNRGFDAGCGGISEGAREMSRLQGGRVQGYLRVVGVALLVIVVLLMWGGRA
jgi:NADH-quinone oxidoreductase subunit L